MNIKQGVSMEELKIEKLDDLTLNLNMDLNILNSALKDDTGDLEICSISKFVERIYGDSSSIRELF